MSAVAVAGALLAGLAMGTPAPPAEPPPKPVGVSTTSQGRSVARRAIPTRLEGRCIRELRIARQGAAFTWAPEGWSLTCSDKLPAGLFGYTEPWRKTVTVNATRPVADMVATYAHELGHAEQAEWPAWKTAALEQVTGRKLGSYQSNGSHDAEAYKSDPGELWARGRAHAATGSAQAHAYYTIATIESWSRWTR